MFYTGIIRMLKTNRHPKISSIEDSPQQQFPKEWLTRYAIHLFPAILFTLSRHELARYAPSDRDRSISRPANSAPHSTSTSSPLSHPYDLRHCHYSKNHWPSGQLAPQRWQRHSDVRLDPHSRDRQEGEKEQPTPHISTHSSRNRMERSHTS
jgi:hypothetical protein